MQNLSIVTQLLPSFFCLSAVFKRCILFCLFLVISSHEPAVPPGAELSLEIKLLEATDAPDLELLPPIERIALASLKRERGNVHYQRGDYAFAVNSYSIALQITESNSKGRIV